MSDLDPTRLVFVGGLHRSGTTPFAKVLGEHPEVSGLVNTGVREDEGQHLQPVYPKAKVHGGSGRFAYAAQAHLTESSPLISPANAQAMLDAWKPYWDLEARLLVEKSPPNIIMGRFLQEMYPGSAFIVVVRHPVTVALSNKKWRRFVSKNPRKFETLSGMVDHWLTAHDILAADLPHLKRALVIHYERLVSQPDTELSRVEDFLSLSAPIDRSSFTADHGSSYAQWWEQLRSPWRPGGWQRRRIERKQAGRAWEYGYDVCDLSRVEPVDPDGFQLRRS
ncbi:MAG: sulfotransferase [Tetrasphaera sp.]|nr:sulfotransferase [Tetrasphaera sp.]